MSSENDHVIYFNEDPRLPRLLSPCSDSYWIDYRPGSSDFEGFRATLETPSGGQPILMLLRHGSLVYAAVVAELNSQSDFRRHVIHHLDYRNTQLANPEPSDAEYISQETGLQITVPKRGVVEEKDGTVREDPPLPRITLDQIHTFMDDFLHLPELRTS